MKIIYMADVEIKPLPDSEHYGQYLGACVYCFIPASTEEEAKQLLDARLKEDRYEVLSLDSLEPFSDVEFEKARDQLEAKGLAARAFKSNELVYGVFHCYDNL